jgi:imidazoleglycerol-phosphate dehydratase
MMRQAVKERKTLETAVSVSIGLDGSGKADIATGVGFFDHADTAGKAWFS